MKFTIQYYKEEYGWTATCKEEPDVSVRAESEEAATALMREALETRLADLVAQYAEARERGGEAAEALERKLKSLDVAVSFRMDGGQE